MRSFFKSIIGEGFTFAWEPRGKWSDDLVKELCQELGLIHCVDPFQRSSVYGEVAHFRLHGRTGYRYIYTDEDLNQLLHWCQQYEEGYCLFNNISMFQDALRMKEVISG